MHVLVALQPTDVQAGHGAHALRICGVALLENCCQPTADLEGVVQVLCLWESRIPIQYTKHNNSLARVLYM